MPLERPGTRMVYHLYPIRCRDESKRNALREHLKSRGIDTGMHYPIANHLQPAMASRGTPPSLPESEAIARTSLSLPIFPTLSDADVETVIGAVTGFFEKRVAE